MGHKHLAPNSTIGILGGGQLGRMAALAAANLGYRCHIFTPEADSPAAQVSAAATVASFDDHNALTAFAQAVDVVTLEFENVPPAAVEFLARTTPVRPGADILRLAQHRALEKTAAVEHGLTPVPWKPVTSLAELEAALTDIGAPAVLKTSRLGYDGKGQRMIETAEQAADAWQALNTDDAVLEKRIDLAGEISVITVRGLDGTVLAYPPGENIHKDHILDTTRVPAQIPDALVSKATEDAKALADALGYIGVLGVEFFIAQDGSLYFNEMAPRPHNSGHWTMDAAITSQFEQQVRAVAGLPLGPVDQRCPVIMENLVGDPTERAEAATADPRGKLHLYGKAEARAGRKMGHINWLDCQTVPDTPGTE
ncbi:MAG: 5-(carboxyamino)imidazole ribonucleotide synthase [Alphaproteobacteria bacterium]|nr:5-(carboxyamino)imidazole ribonucleotide synthase [Alphaproteobacteria bacterium SS10]